MAPSAGIPERRWAAVDRAAATYLRAADLPLRLRLLRWLGRQTWMVGQDRLLRLLCDPETAPHVLFDVDFFGQRYRGDLAHYIDWLVFCYGTVSRSEITVLEAAAAALRRRRAGPLSFADVGANAGHHTLFMAGIADRVIAFEPLPALCALIDDKIALNRLGNVTVFPLALGERDETRDYLVGRGANSGEGTFTPDGPVDAADLIKIPVRNGDRLFAAEALPRIDLMKVDVEGFEPFVFRGLAARIGQDRPVILTEMSAMSRRGFGLEAAFRAAFYPGARFAEVAGGIAHPFRLRPFTYAASPEVLIVPPEMADFISFG